tara:strand:- start:1218 stop:2228 length:1011 start_codon:yes stop_codon:yes gene_type:complete
MKIALKLESINKSYGEVVALKDINLEVYDGEFFSLLGPSGSGKTTCLKVIAGFENSDTGSVNLFDEYVTDKPPFKRLVNTVFQDYALFPHMNVYQNVGYSLRIKKISKEIQDQKIKQMLSIVKLEGYSNRKPNELSGGQRQRVALARSLINEPKILLLDEPLGALDLKLREQMQVELKNLQRQFKTTFIYVTHDQQEALSMSDRIAIFNNGSIDQIDTPNNIYLNPKSSFVADFVGTTSIINKEFSKKYFNYDQSFSIRPENIKINSTNVSADDFKIEAIISEVQFHGSYLKILFKFNEIQLIAFHYINLSSKDEFVIGDQKILSFSKSEIKNLNE